MKRGVKFCGITQEADIHKAASAGARAVGVIVRPDRTLHERSEGSHSVGIERACQLAKSTPFNMEFVVAARTDDYEEIVEIGESIGPNRLQVAQVEDLAMLKDLATRFRGGATPFLTPVIHVGEGTDPAAIDRLAPHVRFFHLDSAGAQPGGNGEPHDWHQSHELVARAHAHGRLVILAGGLNSGNVAEAVAIAQPDGADAESAQRIDGVYDEELMRQFVQTAMGAVQR